MTKSIRIMGYVIALLVLIVSGIGVLNQNIYQDNEFVKSMWFGNDLITFVVALPLLIFCLIKTAKMNKPPLSIQLLWMGCLWYLIYNYIYYGYGAAYNPFFILYIVIIALSFVSFLFLFAHVYTCFGQQIKTISEQLSLKGLGIFMIVFATIIGGMWLIFIIVGLLNQELPIGIEQTGHPTGVVFITDFIFLVTPLVVVGILLLQKKVVAIILSYVILIKCILYPVVLLVAGIISYIKVGVFDPMTPAYVILGLICVAWFRFINKKFTL